MTTNKSDVRTGGVRSFFKRMKVRLQKQLGVDCYVVCRSQRGAAYRRTCFVSFLERDDELDFAGKGIDNTTLQKVVYGDTTVFFVSKRWFDDKDNTAGLTNYKVFRGIE